MDTEVQQVRKLSKLPITLIILGLLEAITPLIITFILIPQFQKHFESVSVTGYKPAIDYGLMSLVWFVSLIQIGCGIFLITKQKKFGGLSKAESRIATIIQVVSSLIVMYSLGNFLLRIVQSINSLQTTF